MTIVNKLTIDEVEAFFKKNAQSLITFVGTDYLGKDEERNGLVYKLSLENTVNSILIQHIQDFTYEIDIVKRDKSTKKVQWHQLQENIQKILKELDVSIILLDITDLDLETLIYILPEILKYKVYITYILPGKYSSNNFTITPKDIRQPKGYAVFLDEDTASSSHIIILGFDKLRAHKFIKQYDWALNNLKQIAVTDNNSELRERIKEANSFSDQSVSSIHYQEVKLLAYDDIVNIIEKELEEKKIIDIVPLGPKPILLHILLYYFKNQDRLQNRIRILYDYPKKSKNRTEGIQKICMLEVI